MLNFERAEKLLKSTLAYLEQDSCELGVALSKAREIGFSDREISDLGFCYFLDDGSSREGE